MKKSRDRINQEVSDRLDALKLSKRAQDVIGNTDISLIAELFGDLQTAEEVEEYIAREYASQEAVDLAAKINAADEWNMSDLAELCEMAGIEDEWNAADGETFEEVAYKAAEILKVDI